MFMCSVMAVSEGRRYWGNMLLISSSLRTISCTGSRRFSSGV